MCFVNKSTTSCFFGKSLPFMKYITVYCASSSKLNPIYLDATKKLGELLVENEIGLVYGGGSVGLMGQLADTMMSLGGKVIGVIPRFMCEVEWQHKGISELIITETMHERKAKMAELGDATIALAGGVGTMEELFEIITWKQLGIYEKPIVILNTNNYYQHLIQQLKKSSEELFIRPQHLNLWSVVREPKEVFLALKEDKKIHENMRKFAKI